MKRRFLEFSLMVLIATACKRDPHAGFAKSYQALSQEHTLTHAAILTAQDDAEVWLSKVKEKPEHDKVSSRYQEIAAGFKPVDEQHRAAVVDFVSMERLHEIGSLPRPDIQLAHEQVAGLLRAMIEEDKAFLAKYDKMRDYRGYVILTSISENLSGKKDPKNPTK